MGKRLSKIYTRTGDAGETGLGDGSRIAKSHPRLEAIGTVDELNSGLGLLIEDLKAEPAPELVHACAVLRGCQHRIFDLGGELSIPGYAILTEEPTVAIETELDTLNETLEPLENFILPGGSRPIASAHLARAICRRTERAMVVLAESEEVNPHGLTFINRLSDYLFVLARAIAKHTGVDEVLWQQ